MFQFYNPYSFFNKIRLGTYVSVTVLRKNSDYFAKEH